MKKISLFIIALLSFIVYIPNTLAINYYDSVNVTTIFEEDIDIDNIKQIEIAYADETGYTKYFMLQKENNFEHFLESVPVGNITIEYGVVDNDTIGYYNLTSELNVEGNIANMVIYVSLQNNEKTVNEIPSEIKEILTPNSNYSAYNNSTSNIEDNPDIEISTTIKTTKSIKEENEIKEQEKEENKKKHDRKSNIIGIIMYSTLGIVILIAGLYATIKIIKANK